jgi:hypothetical protein
LTKATVDQEIEWETKAQPPQLDHGTDDVISFYVETEYKGQIIGLYERRYRAYDGEHDVQYWTGTNALAFVGTFPRREIMWEHRENSSALDNLIRIARESASGIDEILDDLLK